MRGGARRRAIHAQIAAGDGRGDESDVCDTGAEYAGGVEMTIFHVLDAGRRDQPIRRLEAGDAAERRRPDHRARGLAAEGQIGRHAGGDRRRPSPTTSRPAYARDCADCAVARRHHAGANSVVTVLPITDAAGARALSATAAASARGWKPA